MQSKLPLIYRPHKVASINLALIIAAPDLRIYIPPAESSFESDESLPVTCAVDSNPVQSPSAFQCLAKKQPLAIAIMVLGLLASAVTAFAAFLFPTFASYKAIKANDNTQLAPWLMFWSVQACFLFVEHWLYFLLQWYVILRFSALESSADT